MRTVTEIKAEVLKISKVNSYPNQSLERQFHFLLGHVFMKVRKDMK